MKEVKYEHTTEWVKFPKNANRINKYTAVLEGQLHRQNDTGIILRFETPGMK